MKILDRTGKALDTDHKRVHDSERVMGIRNMLNGVMRKLIEGWTADNAGDPSGATRPNEASIDQHYITKWVEQCTTIMNSVDPVEVDPDAMKNWIAAQRATKFRKQQMESPLHALVDLEPMGFKLLGMYKGAAIWISTECAVMLVPGGMVAVYMKCQDITSKRFACTACMMMVMNATPDVILPDYTLGELTDYLMAQRRERPAHPEEADMEVARKQLSPAQS